MYLTMLSVFIFCGFAWSVRSAKNVNSIFHLKSNTSSLGSFTGMAAVLSFLLLPNSGWVYLLIPIYVSAAAFFFRSEERRVGKEGRDRCASSGGCGKSDGE